MCKLDDTAHEKKRKLHYEVKSEVKAEQSVIVSSPERSDFRQSVVDNEDVQDSVVNSKARYCTERGKAIRKAMTKLLRYKTEEQNVEELQEGEHWVQVQKAIIGINRIVRKTSMEFRCTEQDIQHEVETSVHEHYGPRFELFISGSEKWVRARNIHFYRSRHRHLH